MGLLKSWFRHIGGADKEILPPPSHSYSAGPGVQVDGALTEFQSSEKAGNDSLVSAEKSSHEMVVQPRVSLFPSLMTKSLFLSVGGRERFLAKADSVKSQCLPNHSDEESEGLSSSSSSQTSGILTNLAIPSSTGGDNADDEMVLQNVKATDYATPQKFLDDPSKIPSYYVFQSNMVAEEDLKPGMLRTLEVDKRLTVPTRTHIKFLITATDVIHSFAVPSLGIKADAVPGRLVKVNTFIQREGVFYGQCSELCGTLHAFMPIVIEAVSPEAYAAHAKKFYRED